MIGEYTTSNGLKRRFVFGPGEDEPLVWYEGLGTSDRRWLHADERGSVTAISDASGNAIAIDAYDEYGMPATGNIGRFQYTGQMWLTETGSPPNGLYHYKARAYAPRLGRFLQTDPIGYGDGLNWYAYVGGDPVNGRDPSGLVEPPDIIVTGQICGGHSLGCTLGIGTLSPRDDLDGIFAFLNGLGSANAAQLAPPPAQPKPSVGRKASPQKANVVLKFVSTLCPNYQNVSVANIGKAAALGGLTGAYSSLRFKAVGYFEAGALRGAVVGGSAGVVVGGVGAVPGAAVGAVEGGFQSLILGVGKDALLSAGIAGASSLINQCRR